MTILQIFLVFNDFDTLEEYWSGIEKHVSQLGFVWFFFLIPLMIKQDFQVFRRPQYP